MFKYLFIVVFILSQASSFAQVRDDAYYTSKLDEISEWYSENLDSAEQLVLALSNKVSDKSKLHCECLSLLGSIYKEKGEFDKSVELHEKVISFRKALNDQQNLAISYIDIASSYNKLSEFELGFRYLDSALTRSEETKNFEV